MSQTIHAIAVHHSSPSRLSISNCSRYSSGGVPHDTCALAELPLKHCNNLGAALAVLAIKQVNDNETFDEVTVKVMVAVVAVNLMLMAGCFVLGLLVAYFHGQAQTWFRRGHFMDW